MGEKMDKDTKEKLDGLALELQKDEVQASQLARELAPKVGVASFHTGATKSSEHEGLAAGYAMAIGRINERFGTDYESSLAKLKEHFREKPCER